LIRVIPQRHLLQTLIAIADQDKMEFSPEHFSGLNALERSCLQSMDILIDGQPYESIWVETVDGPIEAPVFVDPSRNEITLYHPEEGPMLISPDDVRRRKIDPDRFATWTMHALLKMPATRKPEEIVPGYAWDLGTPRLGKKTGIKVVLARRLMDHVVRENIGHELYLTQSNPRTIVLTTTSSMPPDLRIQRASVVVPLLDVISRADDEPGLDLERLAMFAERGSTTTIAEKRPVECEEDGSWLRIYDREYSFRGGKKAIIRILFNAWERGDVWVPVSRLLHEYKAGTRLEDVFKDGRAGHKDKWRDYLEIKDRKARLIVVDL
jgi:hypothetical protein